MNVGRRDLLQPAVVLTGIIAAVRRPAVGWRLQQHRGIEALGDESGADRQRHTGAQSKTMKMSDGTRLWALGFSRMLKNAS
jgi:hypothetical protein